MYSLYSVLVLVIAVVASPWFVYQALRYKKYVGSLGQRLGLLGYEVEDLGNVIVEQPERAPEGPHNARYLPQIAQTCARLAELVAKAAGTGKVPLVLGGDHSVAIGTISGMSKHFRRNKKRMGLLWVDAHPDMNTPQTSPSGNVHGMPLACCIGIGPRKLTHIYDYAPKVDPKNVAMVGIRDVDALEKPHVRKSGVRAFTMRDIDVRGMPVVAREALDVLTRGGHEFHVSFDIDAVDPLSAPGTGTPVPGGLSVRESRLLMEEVADTGRLGSLELVEVNPLLEPDGDATARLAVDLAATAMGRRLR